LIDLLTSGPKEIISIVSTAGTGKTTFLYYFAIRYLREQQENTKILIRIMKTQRSYLLSSVCEKKSAVKLLGSRGTLEAFQREAEDPTVLQLVDGCDAFPAPLPSDSMQAVGFFSPRTWEYRHGEWRKVSKQLCFPVWTLLEIWVLAALLGIPAKKWVPRYVQVGGIPRNVLIDPVDVDSHLNGLDFDQFSECIQVKTKYLPAHCNALIHTVCDPDTFEYTYNAVATPYVARKVADRALQQEIHKLKRFISASASSPASRAFAGKLYEPLVIKEFQKGGRFSVKNLHTGEESFLDVAPSYTTVDDTGLGNTSLHAGSVLPSITSSSSASTMPAAASTSLAPLGISVAIESNANTLPTDVDSKNDEKGPDDLPHHRKRKLIISDIELPSLDMPAGPLNLYLSWKQWAQEFTRCRDVVPLDPQLWGAPSSLLFSSLEELKDVPEGSLRVPASQCFETIDFVILRHRLFQVTVGESHTVKTNGLRRVTKALDSSAKAVFELYVVVPPDVYGCLRSPLPYEFRPDQYPCRHQPAKAASKKTSNQSSPTLSSSDQKVDDNTGKKRTSANVQCIKCARDNARTVRQFALRCDPLMNLGQQSALPLPSEVPQPPGSGSVLKKIKT